MPSSLDRSLFLGMADGCAYCEMVFEDREPVDWIYLDVNPAFERLTGLGQVTGRRVSEVIPGLREALPDVFRIYGRVARSGAKETFERYVDALDSRFEVDAFGAGPGRFIAVFRDISAGKQAAAAARVSEQRLRNLVAELQVGVAILSADSAVLLCNRRATELLGLSEDPLRGRAFVDPLCDVIREDGTPFPASNHPAAQAMASRKPVREAVMGIACPGCADRVWLSVDAEPQLARDGSVREVICTFVDITRRKAAEAEQARMQARLFEAQKLKSLGILVAGVAHTMNNVLAVIMGSASMREPLAPGDADREAFRIIGKACARGRDVVKSLIQFSRPTLPDRVPIEVPALVREVHTLIASATLNRISVLAPAPEEPLWISGDAGSINLALMELCFNAVDAMPDGGTLTLSAVPAGAGQVALTVADTGKGMATEVLEHAMDPFFTTRHDSTGKGLGLSMVYGLVTAHGGTMKIASDPGQGTTVTLRLPRIPAPERAAVAAPGVPVALGKVLLVDDEEDIRFLTARMLRKSGVGQVETAADGEAALACLASGPLPEVVILDQNMPGMSGMQVMARIRELHPDLPILFSSGQPDLERWETLRQPRVAFISKPFTMQEIQDRLAQFAREVPPVG